MKGKLRRLDHVDLVIVDYLQLMTGTKRTDNRVNEISEITRNLKVMAKELNVPVMALSQLRRPTERTKDHRPACPSCATPAPSSRTPTSSSSSTGKPTTHQRGRPGHRDMDQNAAEIIVAKNRHGETKPILSTGRASTCATPPGRSSAMSAALGRGGHLWPAPEGQGGGGLFRRGGFHCPGPLACWAAWARSAWCWPT